MIELDLGVIKEVSQVALATGRPINSIVVSISTDGTNWTIAKKAADLASNTPVSFSSVKTRYLKIELQGSYLMAPSELIVR